MNSHEMITSRYTTKEYDPTYVLSNDEKNKIIDVLRYAPSSINSQPWRFYFVENKAVKKELAAASAFNKEKINDASALIVFSALKQKAFEAQTQNHASEMAQHYYTTYIKDQMSTSEIESWLENQVYLSLGFLMASLGFEGIDSSALEGIDPKAYMDILKLDSNTEQVLFSVAIGKRKATDSNQPSITPKSRLDKHITVKEIS
ncbi:MAG: nitroreductase family protein [Alphaproteobacteria bacterium]|nr:nitroreductase family protein [Alphaproteobacteria bacterium]MBN2779441.1 nitroreductase family protein [Alphaproteobacteria bacterium]